MIKKTNNIFGMAGIGIFANPSKKNMNWKQAKARYPRLNPYGDADRDGVKNKFDCHPFDRKRQDERDEEKEIKEKQEEASENISNILARQRHKEGKTFSFRR